MDPLLTTALIIVSLGLIASFGIRFVEQSERGLIERFGKYNRFAMPGLNWIIPGIEHLIRVDIREQMTDVESQEIITSDSLNAQVDAQVYFKVAVDEKSVYNSQYEAANYERLIVNLARTTLRDKIGKMSLNEANSGRTIINAELKNLLSNEARNWGIEITRAELKEINPPAEVQEVMNQVVVAEKQKIAAKDFANAAETKADGEKRAKIKSAEGDKEAKIQQAEGEAQAIETVAKAKAEALKLVGDATKTHFHNQAQKLKELETVEASLKNNAKIIITKDGLNPLLLLGNGAAA